VTIVKTSTGRFTAKLKSGRQFVTSRTFDTKREAKAWLSRERAALEGGVDPRAGRQRVGILLEQWLEVRRVTVATKTFRVDQSLMRLVPTGMQAINIAAVSRREVARSFDQLLGSGLSERSVVRYRASLSSFFAWCVRERLIGTNPVTGVPVPRSSEEQVEMRPWNEDELEVAHGRWQQEDARLAGVLLLLGWTGLRWAEARALRVDDVVEVPTQGLLVRRSSPEGVGTKATKGRRSRRVPLANRVLPIVRELAEGKDPDDLLVTTSGGAQLHRTAVLRTLRWDSTGEGRRLHDLRHTAACLWLARGVDPGTVQAWMGHESIATTNQYLHFLGSSADRAGLDRLNLPARATPTGNAAEEIEGRGYAGGTPSPDGASSHQ
jgi:integrase